MGRWHPALLPLHPDYHRQAGADKTQEPGTLLLRQAHENSCPMTRPRSCPPCCKGLFLLCNFQAELRCFATKRKPSPGRYRSAPPFSHTSQKSLHVFRRSTARNPGRKAAACRWSMSYRLPLQSPNLPAQCERKHCRCGSVLASILRPNASVLALHRARYAHSFWCHKYVSHDSAAQRYARGRQCYHHNAAPEGHFPLEQHVSPDRMSMHSWRAHLRLKFYPPAHEHRLPLCFP